MSDTRHAAALSSGAAEPARLRVLYVGHATVLVEVDGTRILTDPVLRDRLLFLRARRGAPNLDALGQLDAVLLSHAHWDHLDVPSLARLGADVRVIAAAAAVPWLRRRRYRGRVEPVEPGDEKRVGAVTVRATPALHGRTGSAVGFVVEGTGTVYFAGDTDLFPEMDGLVERLDVALLPIWGWGPRLGPGHLDPARATAATRLLRPRVVVPIHWGTLHPLGMSRRAFLDDPPRAFSRLVRAQLPDVEVRALQPGGELVLPVVNATPE